MEAKEKAKELVDSYIDIMPPLAHQTWYTIMDFAKKCALISIANCLTLANLMDGGFSFEKEIEFLNEVKSEINKL